MSAQDTKSSTKECAQLKTRAHRTASPAERSWQHLHGGKLLTRPRVLRAAGEGFWEGLQRVVPCTPVCSLSTAESLFKMYTTHKAGLKTELGLSSSHSSEELHSHRCPGPLSPPMLPKGSQLSFQHGLWHTCTHPGRE